MTLAKEVWSHMRTQGVKPTELYYVGMIKGWGKAGELWERVRDGSVDRLFKELSSSAFEFVPSSAADGEVEPGVAQSDTLAGTWKCFDIASLQCTAQSGN